MSDDPTEFPPLSESLKQLGGLRSPLGVDWEAENRRLEEQMRVKKKLDELNELVRRGKSALEYLPLLKSLVEDLERKKTQPSVPTFNNLADYVQRWRGRVKEYFHRLKKLVPHCEYLSWVEFFKNAHLSRFKTGTESVSNFPPALLIPPMNPNDLHNLSCSTKMPHLWEFSPRTGGRKKSHSIQDRNMFIANEWAKIPKGKRNQHVCKKLDEAGYPTPKTWGIKKWSKARLDPEVRPKVDSLISKAVFAYGSGKTYRNLKTRPKQNLS